MKYTLVTLLWGKLRWILCCMALTLLLTACLDDDDNYAYPPTPIAYVSFYHASPDAPNLDITVDSRTVTQALEYADYTSYLNFYTGDRKFKFNAFKANNVLIDTSFTFNADKFYSVFVIDQLSRVEAFLVSDSGSAPAAGKAKVRLVHLSPDAPAIDLVTTGQEAPLFTDQSFKEATAFTEIEAGEQTFSIKTAGGTDTLLSADKLRLKAGEFYTILIRGFTKPPSGNNNNLNIQVINN